MATLQKFKLLATQCAVVAGSPTQSPTASPVIHLRRRKTLRMFLSRPDRRRFPRRSTSSAAPDDDDDDDRENDPSEKKKNNNNNIEKDRVRHKLKDLFVSSPPPPPNRRGREVEEGEEHGLLSATDGGGGLARTRRGAGSSMRPLTASFRCRLLKRAWRPVLVPIPE
ncbi:hypothetical protein M0R45_036547 [Rubus argutus]|uniref:Uncharacterized protein n=1 Tax=Rubus argutus TaxID=59490 RepID=A0AAW1W0Q7_RUBAR